MTVTLVAAAALSVTVKTALIVVPVAPSVTVTYVFTPPGGVWNVANAGAYTIAVVANSVKDIVPTVHFVAAGTVGTVTAFPIVVTQVGAAPAGTPFYVDGTSYTSQQTFSWPITSVARA